MINIRTCTTKKEYDWIEEQMENSVGIKEVFEYNANRLKTSSVATLVFDNNIPIGFIYIAHEMPDEKIGFIDMGIINNKIGNGYGKQALDIFLNKTKNIDMFLIAETKKENEIAKRSLSKYECIYQKDDSDFYLLNRSLEELKEEGLYEELTNHLNSNRISSKDMVKSLY